MLQERPGIDQVTLASEVALDTSTTADICARLETKAWVLREVLPRRQRRLVLTASGAAVLARLVPGLVAMNQDLLSRQDDDERQAFMHLLRKFVQLNNDQSRAPSWSAASTGWTWAGHGLRRQDHRHAGSAARRLSGDSQLSGGGAARFHLGLAGEQAAGDQFLPCCSRLRSPRLVLDL